MLSLFGCAKLQRKLLRVWLQLFSELSDWQLDCLRPEISGIHRNPKALRSCSGVLPVDTLAFVGSVVLAERPLALYLHGGAA